MSADRLKELLRTSPLSNAEAALLALDDDAVVSFTGNRVRCEALRDTYSVRSRILARKSSDHAKQLQRSVDEFVRLLDDHLDRYASFASIRPKEAEHSFDLYLTDGLEALLGCLRVVSKSDVCEERWAELWGRD